MADLELINNEQEPRRTPARPAVDADPPAVVAKIDELGRRLVWLASHDGNPDVVLSVCKQMQPGLLEVTLRRMYEEGLPFGEYLIAGQAVEFTILEGVRRPTTRFYKLFLEQIDITFELFRLQHAYVDRWVLEERGLSARQQARVAGMVEVTLQLSRAERRIVFHYIRRSRSPETIAAATGVALAEVRAVLARVARAARSRADEWFEKWKSMREMETKTKKSARRRPSRGNSQN
ncbi:MAG: hypothetical protein HY286_15905 [Planctomycetes bacterium]|nr:hypothetical protein [Planctomycetota bacterium]